MSGSHRIPKGMGPRRQKRSFAKFWRIMRYAALALAIIILFAWDIFWLRLL